MFKSFFADKRWFHWSLLGSAMILAVTAGLILIINREGWRRAFLKAEDPRAMAVFRIAFAFCAMCNINGLWELFEYLFTDEGIFLTDVARRDRNPRHRPAVRQGGVVLG